MTERECRTCGKPFQSTRGRRYCSRECWPSESQGRDDLEKLRAEILEDLERGIAPGINELALRRLDEDLGPRK
jgi:hypothetical protein